MRTRNNSVCRGLIKTLRLRRAPPTIVTNGNLRPKGEIMADERQIASGSDLGKDPVFLVMVTGQIESAEVSYGTLSSLNFN